MMFGRCTRHASPCRSQTCRLVLIGALMSSASASFLIRDWLDACNHTMTDPAIATTLVSYMVNSSDPYLLEPVADLLERPVNWRPMVEEILACVEGEPALASVLHIITKRPLAVDITHMINDLFTYGMLMERFNRRQVRDLDYAKKYVDALDAVVVKTSGWFQKVKYPSVKFGLQAVIDSRETNRSDFLESSILNLNIVEAVINGHSFENRALGLSLLRAHKFSLNHDMQQQTNLSPEWNIRYYLWNLLFVNDRNLQSRFLSAFVKLAIPSVICTVARQDWLAIYRVPPLFQHIVFSYEYDPKKLLLFDSDVSAIFDEATLQEWRAFNGNLLPKPLLFNRVGGGVPSMELRIHTQQ